MRFFFGGRGYRGSIGSGGGRLSARGKYGSVGTHGYSVRTGSRTGVSGGWPGRASGGAGSGGGLFLLLCGLTIFTIWIGLKVVLGMIALGLLIAVIVFVVLIVREGSGNVTNDAHASHVKSNFQTKDDVRIFEAILADLAVGEMKQVEIAQKYNVPAHRISAIKCYKLKKENFRR